MSNFYGTITIAAGTRATADIGASGLSGVLIGNESGLTVIVTMQGANTSRSLYPGTVDWFPIPPRANFNGNLFFDPTANLSNASSWPSSYVQIDTFGPGEAPSGTYPMALPRNTNVGNSVTTNVTNSTLVYDGAVAGSQFIEATAQGDASSGVTLDNSANLVLGNATHKGSITLKGTLSTDGTAIVSDGSGNLTAASIKTNVATATDGNNWAAVTPGTVTRIANPAQVALQVPGGSTVLSAISTGVNVTGNLATTGDITGGSGNLKTINSITDSGGTGWASITPGATVRIQSATQVVIQVPGGSTILTVNSGGATLGTLTVNTLLNLVTGTLRSLTTGAGTGNGTSNTNITNPTAVVFDPCTLSGSTQTIGGTNTSTTTVTTGAGLAWRYIAYLQ